MIKKLILCSVCNQVIPNYEGCGESQNLPGVEWSDADLAKAKEFLMAHSGHSFEELTVEKESRVGEKPAYEPLGVTDILAGKGDRKFLVRRTKIALDQSASYEIIPGKLKIFDVSLSIQEDEIRKQIVAEKGFSLLLKRKMEKFIEAFRDEMESMSPEDFEGEAEAIEEGETSLIAYGSLKDFHWERILDRCGRYFKESELRLIGRFIEEKRNPLDVLSIQIQRRISVIPPAEMESAEGIQRRGETGMAPKEESNSIAEREAAKKKE